ncbi:hypothetical protein [Aquimarina algicola]|uniref:Uncharacterized protein n=1 Tax=Aquimarina algicola TaxID=2589995 RepID=A0A504JKW3_9FLAO|nr:hypothetical protein [Aquimarina algicola]TPN88995.1 hypothetical protein FHK87_01890 [Aquimarina algicola]
MKNSIHIFLVFILLLCACDDDAENEPILPEGFSYISFDASNKSVNENDTEPATVTFIYSSSTLPAQDLTINYTITFPEENAAQEGVDFILPSNSGSFILPAGQSTVEVPLFDLVNDDLSVGSRSIIFNLSAVEGFTLGKPGERESKSVEITIQEDDLFEFGFTSFEDVPTFGTLTTYPRPAASTNPLPNVQDTDPSSEAPYVSFVSTGDELGFTASFIASSVTDIEEERMGVYNNTVAAANPDDFETTFIDGDQAYITSDLDGELTLTFDEITGLNPDVADPVLDIKFFFRTTSWESTDGLAVYFETAEGRGQPLLSVFDDDAEDIEGVWQELRIPIPEDRLATGRLVVTMFNGAGSETIIIDSISIKGIK